MNGFVRSCRSSFQRSTKVILDYVKYKGSIGKSKYPQRVIPEKMSK